MRSPWITACQCVPRIPHRGPGRRRFIPGRELAEQCRHEQRQPGIPLADDADPQLVPGHRRAGRGTRDVPRRVDVGDRRPVGGRARQARRRDLQRDRPPSLRCAPSSRAAPASSRRAGGVEVLQPLAAAVPARRPVTAAPSRASTAVSVAATDNRRSPNLPIADAEPGTMLVRRAPRHAQPDPSAMRRTQRCPGAGTGIRDDARPPARQFENAAIPVCARPRISACTSCVPS